MVAHPSVGVKSARELIALAKKHPGITCGNSGIGTVTHMAAEKFRLRAGIDLTAVNYKGGATSIISLLTGEIATVIVTTIPAALEYVKTAGWSRCRPHVRKALRPAARLSRRSARPSKAWRRPSSPACSRPAGTPRGVIDRLNAEFARAVGQPESEGDLRRSMPPRRMKSAPDALQRALEQDVSAWAEVVKATGVKLQ